MPVAATTNGTKTVATMIHGPILRVKSDTEGRGTPGWASPSMLTMKRTIDEIAQSQLSADDGQRDGARARIQRAFLAERGVQLAQARPLACRAR